MKTVHLYLEDAQYEELVKNKGNMSWIEFVLTLANKKE